MTGGILLEGADEGPDLGQENVPVEEAPALGEGEEAAFQAALEVEEKFFQPV